MHKVRLIYVSVMTDVCDTEALQQILSVSRKNNTGKGITGVLCYGPAFFLQCIEGPRDHVNEVYSNIASDPRHKNVTLLEYADVEESTFGDWSMAFLSMDVLDKEILKKYSITGKFNPYALNAEQIRNFLIEVVEHKRAYLATQR
jgi:hypothetical protein